MPIAPAPTYKDLLDFKTQFEKAARQILDAAGIAAVTPGEGVVKLARRYTSAHFARGAATGRKGPVAIGDRRYYEYSQYEGTLTLINSVPFEIVEKTGDAYITEDHARILDEVTAAEDALFMEHLEPFTPAFLPWLDVQMILPIEPDERPEQEREVNVSYRRWRLRYEIRSEAWPTA